MKGLLRQYLNLKFSEAEEDIKTEPRRYEEILKFKIKTDGHTSSWFKLSQKKISSYSVLSLEKNLGKKITVLSQEEGLIFQEGVLAHIFQGSHLERIIYLQIEKEPDSFWSGWQSQSPMGALSGVLAYLPLTAQHWIYSIGELFASASPPWNEYQKIIHPMLTEASLEILKSCPKMAPKVVEWRF